MKVYVFGNQDINIDNKPLSLLDRLTRDFPRLKFIIVSPNEDVPFANNNKVVIIDTVSGIDKVTLLDETSMGSISKGTRVTVHDFDLGFQLKYLKKLGKLNEISIIGIPIERKADYFSIQSILRKLVAQDMQGS